MEATQELIKAKEWNALKWTSQSSNFKPTKPTFPLLKEIKRKAQTRPTNKQVLVLDAVKAGQCIPQEETSFGKMLWLKTSDSH